MKVAILGAGAVGCYLAAMLGHRGHAIVVLARGPRADSIRANGIAMKRKDGTALQVQPGVADDTAALGRPDMALVCVKGYSVPELASALATLDRAGAPIVFVQNGIPWWYLAEPGSGQATLLDPEGRIAAGVTPQRTIGCVTYVNAQNAGSGLVNHMGDDTFILGRPDGTIDGVLQTIVAAMTESGIAARASDAIRRDIWVKLWGSLAFNPISSLTGATMDRIIAEPDTRPLVMGMMAEAQALARRDGIEFPMTVDQRLEIASRAGAFKTSMLQDLEAGRRLEIDAIIGAVAAHARRLGVPTLQIDTVLGLLRQRARGLGLA